VLFSTVLIVSVRSATRRGCLHADIFYRDPGENSIDLRSTVFILADFLPVSAGSIRFIFDSSLFSYLA